MTGPLIFVVIMVFLVLAARREKRRAELAAVHAAIEAFTAAFPQLIENMKNLAHAIDVTTVTLRGLGEDTLS